MDITIDQEKIIELVSPFSEETLQERALAKRADAFGQLVKFMQRPKAEDVEITETQKRYESFWYGLARAHYKYDRRHQYEVVVADEVQAVTVYGNEHSVEKRVFALDALEHCVEDLTQELMLDPEHGHERDYHKYLAFTGKEIASLEELRAPGTLVEVPEVRSSFLVLTSTSCARAGMATPLPCWARTAMPVARSGCERCCRARCRCR